MSGKVVIQVENLSKHYRLGSIGGATLREDLGRWWARARGKPDPWARVDEVARADDGSEGFWALRDVSFEVREGEVLGVIGRNGAGKSTLLKIFSRITSPTSGRALIRGRVGSLLEVGTGFHPELTGRENIYLNGAILGMTRAEITRKLDEIIEFAEMSRFIDTPVKRYSSGMTVRLAFAVAAHLEPEILVIDEVLAVGDASFQQRCLKRMGELATGGRTVLFVSHVMTSIVGLCTRAIVLDLGRISFVGSAAESAAVYSRQVMTKKSIASLDSVKRTGAGNIQFSRIEIFGSEIGKNPTTGETARVRMYLSGDAGELRPARLGIAFKDAAGSTLFLCANEASSKSVVYVAAGSIVECEVPRLPLMGGSYAIDFFLERNGVIEDWIQDQITISICDAPFYGTSRNSPNGWDGKCVLVENRWSTRAGAELKSSSGRVNQSLGLRE